MKLNKIILITSALLLGAVAYAEDFDSFGDFGDFGDDSSSAGLSSKLEVNGSAEVELRAYVDTSNKDNKDGADKIDVKALPNANLDLKYNGNKSDMDLNLRIDEDTIKNHPIDVIDEAVLRGRLGEYFTLEAGKMKLVWGKGDKLHVLDNFNSDNYADFIIPDYLDRRISTPMVRGVVSLPFANLNIEGVYTPLLPVDRFATSGRWTPAQVTKLTASVTSLAKTSLESAMASGLPANQLMLYLANANNLSSNPDILYPDLWTLKYGQFGGRATWTIGQVDMGISYYNGWYKQPSLNALKVKSFLAAYLADGKALESRKFLAYDKKQTFGLEASTIIWHFNVRGEFAYNLTDDIDGTNLWVHNNSIAWLAGFDIDLPFWNANLNVQETGTYILNGDKCNITSYDVDYSANGYTNNKIVCNLTASFLNDKIKPDITVMYGIENKDLVLMPKLDFKADQNLTFTASGMYIWCGDNNSEFKAWEKNSFVSLAAAYQF